MSNFFTLLITLLITLSASSQHLETSFNIINFKGRYGTQNNLNSIDESTTFDNYNHYQLGLKARYLKPNSTFFELGIESVFGTNEYSFKDTDQKSFNIRTIPQPTTVIMTGLGVITNIKKIRLLTVLKFGLYNILPGITKTEKHYSNNILTRTDIITGQRVNGILIGPNIGVDYEIIKQFYFGITFDFLLNLRENVGVQKRKIIEYNPDGSVDNSFDFNTEFNTNSIDLGGLQMTWSFTYRIF